MRCAAAAIVFCAVIAPAIPQARAQQPRAGTAAFQSPVALSVFSGRHVGDGRMEITAVAEFPTGTKPTSATITIYDTHDVLLSQWKAPATSLSSSTIATTFVQDSGRYRVRVAATDSARRASSASHETTAALQPIAGGLTLSALELGLDGKVFLARGKVSSEPNAIARFELYGGKPGMPVSVTMEVAASGSGPTIAQLSPKITPTPEPDRFIVTAPVNVGSMLPGNYIIRATVGIDGQPASVIIRTFAKSS